MAMAPTSECCAAVVTSHVKANSQDTCLHPCTQPHVCAVQLVGWAELTLPPFT